MLKRLDPGDLRQRWADIRKGLETIVVSRKEGWLPEDVFMAIVSGAAIAYLAYDSDRYAGFVILTISQGYDGKECHVWCAYNEGGRAFMVESDGELPGIAREHGCRLLTFFSERPGWDKVAPSMGWERVHTLYRKQVMT